ncbi:hypothetical protein TWF718_005351 [Orbilia javanica]|uniref:BTB domain-containing protein n=1 Tax=Orbilia javanica TaxID=47235 RepID=A0AAN8N076_9PEZI
MPVFPRGLKRKSFEAIDNTRRTSREKLAKLDNKKNETSEEPRDSLILQSDIPPDVLILVGPLPTPFNLHAETLSAASDFFRGAFRTSFFKEGRERILKLPEVDPAVFDIMVKCIYRSTTYEALEIVEGSVILEVVKTADYLFTTSFKTEILMNLSHRVSAYLQERYLGHAIDSYTHHVGKEGIIVFKSIAPKDAVDIIASIYDYCHSDDIIYLQRCLCTIAAATIELHTIEDGRYWNPEVAALWEKAKIEMANHQTCRKCNQIWLPFCNPETPERDRQCTCWRQHFPKDNLLPPSSSEVTELPEAKRQRKVDDDDEATAGTSGSLETNDEFIKSLTDITTPTDLTFFVGEDLQAFKVHQSIFVPKSLMVSSMIHANASMAKFHAASNSQYLQRDPTVTIEWATDINFRTLAAYMYKGKATLKENLTSEEEIFELYEVADYLMIKELKSDILRRIVQMVQEDITAVRKKDEWKIQFSRGDAVFLRDICVFSQQDQLQGLVVLWDAFIRRDIKVLFNGVSGSYGVQDINDDDEEYVGRELYVESWDELLRQKWGYPASDDVEEAGGTTGTGTQEEITVAYETNEGEDVGEDEGEGDEDEGEGYENGEEGDEDEGEGYEAS